MAARLPIHRISLTAGLPASHGPAAGEDDATTDQRPTHASDARLTEDYCHGPRTTRRHRAEGQPPWPGLHELRRPRHARRSPVGAARPGRATLLPPGRRTRDHLL